MAEVKAKRRGHATEADEEVEKDSVSKCRWSTEDPVGLDGGVEDQARPLKLDQDIVKVQSRCNWADKSIQPVVPVVKNCPLTMRRRGGSVGRMVGAAEGGLGWVLVR